MRCLLFILVLVTFIHTGYTDDKKETAQTVLIKVKQNYDKHSSITYKINYRQKFFDGDDTLKWNATCKLIRDTTDTLFRGRIWFLTTDSFERYYDLNNIYLIDHTKKKITEYKAHQNQTSVITGNTAGMVIKINFLNTGKLLSDLKDTSNKVILLSEEMGDKDHFVISIKYADDESFTQQQRTVWIRKNDFVINKITYKVKYQGDYQYNEWILSDIVFDNVTGSELNNSLNSYSKSYLSVQYIPQSEKDFKLIQAGTIAPSFSGINFQSGKEISLKDYERKFIILDFSYMSCMPCIQSIPHLIQIQNEYGNKNLAVLAINSKDIDQKSKKRLPGFISKHSINYPVILTTHKTDSTYNVKAYPTLYMIDKKGKIIFSQIGFSEKLIDTLKSIINKQQN